MIPQELLVRDSDLWGQGHYGASRGGRTHKGVDLVVDKGEEIGSPVNGIVTKIGWPYADSKKKHMRYVQISNDGYDFRVFYVDPTISIGDEVHKGDIIGVSQDVEALYPSITPHVHLEIKKDGTFIDPTPIILTA